MTSHLLTQNGRYLAQSVGALVLPFVRHYVDVIRNDLLPAFGDLEAKADAVAAARFEQLGSRVTGDECVTDMGDFAEDAEDARITFYITMTNLRQASLNLYAVGLFHLMEQQLASVCRDGLFRGLPTPKDGNLGCLQTWYEEQLGFDLERLSGWDILDELRLVANTTKHAEGGSARQLRRRRPDLFQNPIMANIVSEQKWPLDQPPVDAPLAGDGLFVKDSDFEAYGETMVLFVESMINSFGTLQKY